jgi:opine dehydrogenase
VPFSLVPLVSLGKQFGVTTWATDAMVRLACVVHGTNYYERGRIVEDMGLKGLRVNEVIRYVEQGQVKPIYAFTSRQNVGARQQTTPTTVQS